MIIITIILLSILIYYLLMNKTKIDITDFKYIFVKKVEDDIHVVYSNKELSTHDYLGYYCIKTKTLYSSDKKTDYLLLNLIHQPINKILHV